MSRLRRSVARVLAHRAGAIGIAGALLAPCAAQANPQGAQVVHGSAQITVNGATMSIANTPGTIINWQRFGIDPGEITRFLQQSASSAVLNRVVGGDPSAILGSLVSNGRVLLINPNGVMFGPGATVDTAGLLVSTLDMRNEDFVNGRLEFAGTGAEGAVVNEGAIRARGSVVLIAPRVENSGIIETDGGGLLLAAGREVTITSLENPEVSFILQAPEHEAVNLGRLAAAGGAASVFAGSIRHSGEIDAAAVTLDARGRVQLVAKGDLTLEPGSRIDASGAQGGDVHVQSLDGTLMADGARIGARGEAGVGGDVRLLGVQVGVTGSTSIDASGRDGGGQVLVGGDFQGANPDVPNARATFFGRDASIRADATGSGDGGRVILWADDVTRAYGEVSARGGDAGGDGGFVEISGKRYLVFEAFVDTRASQGRTGTLLLDPNTIEIIDAPPGSADGSLPTFTNVSGVNATISATELEVQSSSVTLEAADGITLKNLSKDQLNLGSLVGGQSFTLRTTGAGDITFEDPNDEILTAGANIVLEAAGTGNLNVGKLRSLAGAGGDISLLASGGNVLLQGAVVSAGTTRGNVDISAGGSITAAPAGTLSAAKVKLTAGAGIALTGANDVLQLTAENTAAGNIDFNYVGPGPLVLSNNGTAFAVRNQAPGGQINIGSSVDMQIFDKLIGADAINLTAGGAVTQSSLAATVTATVLNIINATSASFDLSTHAIDGLGAVNVGAGGISLLNGTGTIPLALNGIASVGDVAVTNSGGISVVGIVDTGSTGDIVLNELTGAINGAGGKVRGNAVDLSAPGGIGGGTVLKTDVLASLSLAAGAGSVTHVEEENAIGTSAISVNAPGGATRLVKLDVASGNLTVDGAFGNANDNVELRALNGGIVQSGGSITGKFVGLFASGSIGTAGAAGSVKTQTGILSATVDPGGGGGDILIDNTGDVTITGLGTPGGDIRLNQNSGTGAVTITNLVNAGNVGAISLRSTGAMQVGAGVTGFGTVALSTGGGTGDVLTIQPGVQVRAIGNGDVLVTSQGTVLHDGAVLSPQGNVTLAAGGSYLMGTAGLARASLGNVSLSAGSAVTLGALEAPGGIVNIDAGTLAAITDGNAGAVNVTGQGAILRAASIGSLADPIETALPQVDSVTTSPGGSVALSNTSASPLLVNTDVITSTSGDILIGSSNGLSANGVLISSAGQAVLDARGGTLSVGNGSTVIAAGPLSVSGAAIDVLGASIGGSDTTVDTGGALRILGQFGPGSVNATNNTTVTAGSLLIEGGASTGDSAKLHGGNTVSVTTTSGSVIVRGGAGPGAFASIDPATLTINAAGDIVIEAGSGEHVDINASSLISLVAGGRIDIIGSSFPAAVLSNGGVDIAAGTGVSLIQGIDPSGDAVIVAGFGTGAGSVSIVAPTCSGCNVLSSDPFTDSVASAGVFGQLTFTSTVMPPPVVAPPSVPSPPLEEPLAPAIDSVLTLAEVADALISGGALTGDTAAAGNGDLDDRPRQCR